MDDSGGIDREEFDIIVKVSCAQIFGRVLVNYATLIFVIPFFAKLIVDRYLPNANSYVEMICIQFTGVILFVVFVPLLWKILDQFAHSEAGRQASKQKSERLLKTTGSLDGTMSSDDELSTEKEPTDKKMD